MKRARFVLLLLLLVVSPSKLDAEGWSALTGRVVLEGIPPTAERINHGRDACCVLAKPGDERWLVGDQGGLANVVITIKPKRGEVLPLPEGSIPPQEPAVLNNSGCTFDPRVLLVRVGQPLVLANEDPTTHNVAATLGRNPSFNLVLPAEGRHELRLDHPERKPMPVACNIHPFMRGYLVVREDPYAAITDTEGRFAITPVPAGTWEFQFWHEGKYLTGAHVDGGKTDTRGCVVLTLPKNKPFQLGNVMVKTSE